GRLERLYVDYTGAVVERGQPLVTLYSPELYSAQQEAIEARRVLQRLQPGSGVTLRATAEATLEAARTKLRLWGLSAEQIAKIESSAAPSEEVIIRAPIGGVVTHFSAREGMYVSTGSALYTIADLGTLWAQFDAYETDLPWLRVGDTVSFTTTAFPGEVFYGKLSFIDPVVDPMRRIVQVRADVDNSDGRLKPEMLARGTIAASYTKAKSGAKAPLLIPASAPLLTGKRAVVYVLVSESEDEGMIFEGREVELGPRSDGFYSVVEGLIEGERVVTHGAFKLDSELQIQAKPSMMNPEGTGGPPPGHDHGSKTMAAPIAEVSTAARTALTPLYNAYFTTQMALANDDLAGTQAGYSELTSVIGDVDMSVFSDHNAHQRWMELSAILTREASRGRRAEDLTVARDAFYHLSNAAIDLHKTFGHVDSIHYYLTFCPMARDNAGAYWLQTTDVIWNSYWGERMLRCGTVKDSLQPAR
ncbi:MAG TPA: efflux RND transporter periplasmic adaptor subunit, partial [candidate division Zixibacteria bacterium]|nr:efflux RND transporter periplasmic adaptor subunit [candidate division Zixibacteria bacterium]